VAFVPTAGRAGIEAHNVSHGRQTLARQRGLQRGTITHPIRRTLAVAPDGRVRVAAEFTACLPAGCLDFHRDSETQFTLRLLGHQLCVTDR